ncbi:hypothetical protein [Galbibacter sp.]|jgi:hypothetical protein|uniref:hypothetical protein n=1 Tax=Galbibacter sp. TaxID=2918471 RepID=UPI003A8C9D3A
MKIIKTTPAFSVLLALVFMTTSCSSGDDDPKSPSENFAQQAKVYPLSVGLMRNNNIKIFASELPYESFDTFDPITSVEVPEDLAFEESVAIDMEAYVGKTLYFVALRKYLLSDDYYNITSTASEPLSAHSATIGEEEGAAYQISLVLAEPESEDYWQKANLTLKVESNGQVVASQDVYWFGKSLLWSDSLKQNIEDRYVIDETVAYSAVAQTSAAGTVEIEIPVDEAGTVEGGSGPINNNEHVFFVIDANGKVQTAIVDIASLEMEQTLSY